MELPVFLQPTPSHPNNYHRLLKVGLRHRAVAKARNRATLPPSLTTTRTRRTSTTARPTAQAIQSRNPSSSTRLSSRALPVPSRHLHLRPSKRLPLSSPSPHTARVCTANSTRPARTVTSTTSSTVMGRAWAACLQMTTASSCTVAVVRACRASWVLDRAPALPQVPR